MAPFYPLYVRRSDGQTEVIVKAKRTEPNQPTSEQLDQRPNKQGNSDFYREVNIDEPKHIDWRRKLGGMLAREMDWKDKAARANAETGYILVSFPENYRLYEHVKKTEKDGKLEVKLKTHAAAGHDRQDAYLYGHPQGRKKRYRSPADFFPHLLWLCTDESGDPDNCSCKICTPEDLADIMPETKVKKPEPAGQQTFATVKPTTGSKLQQDSPTPVPRPSSTPRQLIPTPLPAAKSQDQQIDRQYNSFMYRSGEMVWFKRGPAWGLGLITRRYKKFNTQHHYVVQPLSHPYQHPPSVIKTSHAELRPWLAWSVPGYTHATLNDMPDPPRYETMDWEGLMQKRYGPGDMEVDGSILAAKAVDSTYTPLHPTHTSEDAEITTTHYTALYLGAEKLWLGEPLRLHAGNGTDILILHAIIIRAHKTTAQRTTHLVGDIYQLHQTPQPHPGTEQTPHLPPQLTEDLHHRNATSIPTHHLAAHWTLRTPQASIPLTDVKGRWYAATLLLPHLHAAAFEEAARKGEIREATLWMNSRGDCLNSNRAATLPRIPREDIYKRDRLEAFGRAVPAGTEVREGTEAPVNAAVDPALSSQSQGSMEIDPRFETADAEGEERPGNGHGMEGAGLEEFMDLDGERVEHELPPGFGQEYGSQGSGYF